MKSAGTQATSPIRTKQGDSVYERTRLEITRILGEQFSAISCPTHHALLMLGPTPTCTRVYVAMNITPVHAGLRI